MIICKFVKPQNLKFKLLACYLITTSPYVSIAQST